MFFKLPNPYLGVIIPSFLISFIGYSVHYFIFRHYHSFERQVFFQACLNMIWISYIIAIKKDPGSPKKNTILDDEKENLDRGYHSKDLNFRLDKKTDHPEWIKFCEKCQIVKPERSHHCKSCNKCIYKMDHHCPWTMNCVGYNNMPHFMRFLFWVDFTTFYVFIELCKSGYRLYKMKDYPSYMINKSEIIFTILLFFMDSFVLLSVGLLSLKCIIHIVSGMSQIETWEWERLETQLHRESFWEVIRHYYKKLHNVEKMPNLVSMRSQRYFHYKNTKNSDHFLFSIDDIVFPYDYGFLMNIIDQLNYPWLWLLPWTGPKGNGTDWKVSDLVEEDELGLPWPPDGGRQSIKDLTNQSQSSEWSNSLGEKLSDYGVED